MVSSLMVFQGIVSVLLILMVLVQFGKGAEAGLFTGTSDSVFTGSQQGNILSKITVVLAILFLGNSILLAKIQSNSVGKSLLDQEAVARPLNTDAVPVPGSEAPAAPTTENQVPAATEKPADAPQSTDKK